MTRKTIQDIAVDAIHDIAGGSCCGMVCQVRAGEALGEIERLSAATSPDIALTFTPDEVVMLVEAWDEAWVDDYLPFDLPPGCSCRDNIPEDEDGEEYEHVGDCPIRLLGDKLQDAYQRAKKMREAR